MELIDFDPGFAEIVSTWATSPDEAQTWCSFADAPLPIDVIIGWSAADDVQAYLLVDDDSTTIGYGELWIDDDESEVELARLIISPERRGQGVGRIFVQRLTELARAHHPTVALRVRPDNTAALLCYAGAGFRRVPSETEAEWNKGQPAAYAWMVDGSSYEWD